MWLVALCLLPVEISTSADSLTSTTAVKKRDAKTSSGGQESHILKTDLVLPKQIYTVHIDIVQNSQND